MNIKTMIIYQRFFLLLALIFANYTHAEKPVLVLFPIEVGSADSQFQGEFGSALQEGLQSRYKVFFGPAVEEELEREYKKIDCDAERCQQNVAIAFNGELVADASAKRLGDGYILKIIITNVITNELVESRTYPCRGCDGFAVIESFQEIGRGTIDLGNSGLSASSGSIKTPEDSLKDIEKNLFNPSDGPSIFLFDSVPSGADVTINGQLVGKTPYQGLDHAIGEKLNILITKKSYKPYPLKIELDRPLVRMKKPISLEPEVGELLVSIAPYESGAELWIEGKNFGSIPRVITLSVGQHSLKIKKDGATIGRQSAFVEADSRGEVILKRRNSGGSGGSVDNIPIPSGF